ncbi:MAG: ATPase [Lachnospiraceae bacterium]|nr:ATPase [Lachnospiraceae bacterium]
MAANRIEEIIDNIITFVDSCKMQPLSSTKVVVPKDELLDMLDELKLRTPDEIKRYQKIIANRDSIIAQAEDRARQIEEEARERARALIDENEIMQQAYAQAHKLVDEATAKSNELRTSAEQESLEIRTAALCYTRDMLGEVEKIVSTAYTESKERSERLVNALYENLEVLHQNQGEVFAQLNAEGAPAEDDADFDIPEGAFAKQAGLL